MFKRNGEVLMNLSNDEQEESYEVIINEVHEEYENKEIESTKRNIKIRLLVHWFTMITMLKQRRRSSKLPSSLSER
jgi:hypothetical protein